MSLRDANHFILCTLFHIFCLSNKLYSLQDTAKSEFGTRVAKNIASVKIGVALYVNIQHNPYVIIAYLLSYYTKYFAHLN